MSEAVAAVVAEAVAAVAALQTAVAEAGPRTAAAEASA